MNKTKSKTRISPNSVSLAGEFAALSRLALWGYDANMTLGRTKNVDILVSNPRTNQFYQLEVKTNLDSRKRPPVSKLFGRFVSGWIMNKKHESISRPELWYCFVTFRLESKIARYFIVPSAVVARYVLAQHRLWLEMKGKDNPMRLFRIGFAEEKYRISTPTAERYEDNWEFKQ
ncbi:MAG: hypothetical protein HYZ49_09790 [Chloroflexi bacterium]|nr:hypothetical protein [Chloroflexota bacterium]